jgi:NADH:ubiquinone oxidoreductase subunit 4 (subunit M)
MLRAIRAILYGPLPEKWAGVADAPHLWRKTPFLVLLAALLAFGFFPRLLTDKIVPSVREGVLAAWLAPATANPVASLAEPPTAPSSLPATLPSSFPSR